MALKMLKAKLYEIERAKREADAGRATRPPRARSPGATRSAATCLQPYQLVKDLRTEHETGRRARRARRRSRPVHRGLPAEERRAGESQRSRADERRPWTARRAHGALSAASEPAAAPAQRRGAHRRRAVPRPSAPRARAEPVRQRRRHERSHAGSASCAPRFAARARRAAEEQRYDAAKVAALGRAASATTCSAASIARRGFGKASFLRLRDETGELQLFAKQDVLGDGLRRARGHRHRRPRRGARPRHGDEDRRALARARELRLLDQGAPAAAREVARPDRRRAALPPAATSTWSRTPSVAARAPRALDHRAGRCATSSTRAASSRSRRRRCTRSSAAPRRGRSRRTTTRSTSSSSCASRPSST